jgi:glycosyltransferase involved in cell wall biosynthesis
MDSRSIERIRALAQQEISPAEHRAALELLKVKKVAVFIIGDGREQDVESVLRRIPQELIPHFAEVFAFLDGSSATAQHVAAEIGRSCRGPKISVYVTPFNRGHGGNQKLGYLYCINRGYDIVILLHSHGQYAPEYIPRLLAAFGDDPDAVLASRMMDRRSALEGGMPWHRWLGNRLVSALENRLLGTLLSDFHTGFRAYKIAALKKVPFVFNSDDRHFDTEIVVQAVATQWRLKEVAIPTDYGDPKSHPHGVTYALNCLRAAVRFQLVNWGLFYRRNYDFGLFETDKYQFKQSPHSLHQYLLRSGDFRPDMNSIELGANRGILSSHVAKKVKRHLAIDILLPDRAGGAEPLAMDLNTSFAARLPGPFDACIALDVIEHLDDPEGFLSQVFDLLRIDGCLYISTANVSYLPIRLSLLAGQFNYGKRGVLDRTHKRLFTVAGFQHLLAQYGFQVEGLRGFAPPLTDLVSSSGLMQAVECVHAFLSRHLPALFAYNFVVTARRMHGIADIFEMAVGRCPDGASDGSPLLSTPVQAQDHSA